MEGDLGLFYALDGPADGPLFSVDLDSDDISVFDAGASLSALTSIVDVAGVLVVADKLFVVLGSDDSFDVGGSDSVHKGSSCACLDLPNCVPEYIIFLYLVFAHQHLPAASSWFFEPVANLDKFDVVGVGGICYEFSFHLRHLFLLFFFFPLPDLFQLDKNTVDDFIFLLEGYLEFLENLGKFLHLGFALLHLLFYFMVLFFERFKFCLEFSQFHLSQQCLINLLAVSLDGQLEFFLYFSDGCFNLKGNFSRDDAEFWERCFQKLEEIAGIPKEYFKIFISQNHLLIHLSLIVFHGEIRDSLKEKFTFPE